MNLDFLEKNTSEKENVIPCNACGHALTIAEDIEHGGVCNTCFSKYSEGRFYPVADDPILNSAALEIGARINLSTGDFNHSYIVLRGRGKERTKGCIRSVTYMAGSLSLEEEFFALNSFVEGIAELGPRTIFNMSEDIQYLLGGFLSTIMVDFLLEIAPEFFSSLSIEELLAFGLTTRQCLARSYYAPSSILAKLAQDADPQIRQLIAQNTCTNIETLKVLGEDIDWNVRMNVSTNPITSRKSLRTLAHDHNYRVRQAVARHKNSSRKTLGALAFDPSQLVREKVARHKNTSWKTLETLALDASQKVRGAVATHVNSSSRVLQKLMQDPALNVVGYAIMNLHTNLEDLSSIPHRLKSLYGADLKCVESEFNCIELLVKARLLLDEGHFLEARRAIDKIFHIRQRRFLQDSSQFSKLRDKIVMCERSLEITRSEHQILRMIEVSIGETISDWDQINSQNRVKIENGHITGLRLDRKFAFNPILTQLIYLHTLKLSAVRDFKQMSPNLENLQCLENLHIEGGWPDSSFILKKLKKLKLHGEGNVPKTIQGLKQLRILKINSDSMNSLPDSIGNLPSLQILVLELPNLTEIPQTIGQLKSLKELQLIGGRFRELPDSISSLKNLERLIIFNSRLSQIPKSIATLQSLHHLGIYFTDVDTLPPEIGDCTSLKALELIHNKIRALPEFINKLKATTRITFVEIGNH